MVVVSFIGGGNRSGMYTLIKLPSNCVGRRGHARMVVGFTTTYAISAYPLKV
jgi:hypothetical protein